MREAGGKGTSMGRTLAQKIWDSRVVRSADGEPDLLYIDLHLVHEVTSPQAFDGLRLAGRGVRRPDPPIATEDHNVPTSRVTAPRRPRARPRGALPFGVTAKALILAVTAQIGTGGGVGHVIEYRGEAIRGLSMDGRMTVCNMSIEAGARAGLIAPDDTTFSYLEGRPHAPQGTDWEAALDYWRSLPTDPDAVFDQEITLDAAALTPFVTWGTNPAQAAPLTSAVPDPQSMADPGARASAERALTYMDLRPGTLLTDIRVDAVFVGACPSGRLEDRRAPAG